MNEYGGEGWGKANPTYKGEGGGEEEGGEGKGEMGKVEVTIVKRTKWMENNMIRHTISNKKDISKALY